MNFIGGGEGNVNRIFFINEKINVSAENGVGGNVFMEADEIELLEKTKLPMAPITPFRWAI